MKVEELRIGNFLNYKESEVKFSIEDYREVEHGLLNFMKPIPLTEEWLLKFGFNESQNAWTIKHFNLLLEYDEDGSYDVMFEYYYISKLKYVHQLQNIYFALTYKELKIKELCS